MPAVGAEAVAALAGLGSGRLAGSERYYQYRVLRQLDVSALLLRAMRVEQESEPTALQRRLTVIEQQSRLEDLRSQTAAELRGGLADLGGAESSLGQLRESILDVDFLRVAPAELAALRKPAPPFAARPSPGRR